MFSCAYCEISKNSFFKRTQPVAASAHYALQYSKTLSEETGRNVVKKFFLVTIWDLQLKQITIHEDHNILSHSLFGLMLSCFSCEKFGKTLLLVA